MTTQWINRDKLKNDNLKKENFSVIANNSSSNPLEQFLKANPLKSIFEREPVDSRIQIEPFLDNRDEWDNIIPIGEPEVNMENKKKKEKNAKIKINTNNRPNKEKNKQDDTLINSIITSLFTIFIALYVSYNWFFNVVEGLKTKRVEFYERFDFVNYLYFFTEYFYKIVKLFDETISIKIPWFVDLLKGKERSIFVLIFIISYFSVKSIIDFLKRIYGYLTTYIEKGKIDLFKIIYNPKNNNVFATILFFGYVLMGVIESFASIAKKMVPTAFDNVTQQTQATLEKKMEAENFDPSNRFKEALTQFKVLHPISYVIILLIRVSIVYGPTVAISSFLFLFYFKFYSLLGIPYYMGQSDDNKSDLFKGNFSYIEMFRRIHAYMNANQVFREIVEKDENGADLSLWEKILNVCELVIRKIFNYAPYIILFSSIFSVIPSIQKIYSPTYRNMGFVFITMACIGLFTFMTGEMPELYVQIKTVQEWFSNQAMQIGFVLSDASDNAKKYIHR